MIDSFFYPLWTNTHTHSLSLSHTHTHTHICNVCLLLSCFHTCQSGNPASPPSINHPDFCLPPPPLSVWFHSSQHAQIHTHNLLKRAVPDKRLFRPAPNYKSVNDMWQECLNYCPIFFYSGQSSLFLDIFFLKGGNLNLQACRILLIKSSQTSANVYCLDMFESIQFHWR